MNRTQEWAMAMGTLLLGISLPATAATAATGQPGLRSGPTLEARLRGEAVDDAAFAREASATTLRLRLGWRTPVRSGWSAFGELEATGHAFGQRYNSTDNGRTAYPTVADPDNAELNQLYVQYQPDDRLRLTLGRQRLNYDNQRFIGAVGWRQNEQTFDALDLQRRFGADWTLRYSYAGRVQRIYGADHPVPSQARWLLDAHLLNLSRRLGTGSLTAYGYFIDNRTLPASSHRDLGLRYTGKFAGDAGRSWLLSAEWARQSPYADGSPAIGANYSLLEGGLAWHGHTFKLGDERLGGNGTTAFQTPLATLHAFNGWADRFLTTPANGLRDDYASWSHPFGKFTATVAWHDFGATHGSTHYGREADASLAWAFAPKWSALVKLADYRKADVGANVRKGWLSVEYVY